MRVIYLDSLILLNFVLDYLLLLLTGRVTGQPLRRRYIALAALLGGLYAGGAVMPQWPFLLHPLLRAAVGVGMVLIAYWGARPLLRLTAVFFALSAALGGGLYALSLLGGGLDTVHGTVLPVLDLRYILLFAAGAYCVLSLAGRKLARRGARELGQAVISIDGQQVRLTALRDTGNSLTDPMTGKAVVVAEGDALARLLPPEADFHRPAQCFPTLREPQRFRLLPYRSVGVDRGLLLAVKADGVRWGGRDLGARLVALSPTPVSDGGGYQALFFEE